MDGNICPPPMVRHPHRRLHMNGRRFIFRRTHPEFPSSKRWSGPLIRSRTAALAALPLALAAAASAQNARELPRSHAPRPTVAAITPGDLMSRLYVLADDSMMGREAGTRGNVKGTNYVAAQF